MTSSQMIPSNSISFSAHHTFSVKLTPRNYLAWKTQFNPLLNYQNLTELVDGSTIAPLKTIKDSSTPPAEIPNPEYETWYKRIRCFIPGSFLLSQAFEFNAIIYCNIDNDYHSIITALNLRSELVSFHEFHGQLIAHEILLKSSIDLPQANMVTCQSNSAPLLPTPSQNNNHKKSSNWNGNRPRGPCQIYGYRNHTADRCRRRYSRYNSHNQNATPHANYSSTGHSQNNCASSQVPVANYTHGGSTMPWYPDTAVNYHITPDLANLSIPHDYNEHDQLHVGNGQGLKITHTDIYMEQPIGFQDSSHPNYVCALKFYVLIYVDDIFLTCYDSTKLDWFLSEIKSTFPYITDLLANSNMSDCKPCHKPMSTSPPLSKLSGDPLSNAEQYSQVVGSLQYITLTRPDISFSVNKLSQFMYQPTQENWTVVKRLLRYLKATIGFDLFFSQHSTLDLQCFTDSDWGGCPNDRRSTNGYAVYLDKNPISWTSKKQPTIARSSTESEYRAIANSTAEIIWLRSLLSELGFSSSNPTTLWCDNVGAIYLCSNPVFHAQTKHIELDYHFIREQVQQRNIRVRFISSDDQIADILTKPLGQRLFVKHRDKLRLCSSPPSA
ncbi:hypothetical protein AAG906_035626 [Vitis piasezkii]